MFSPSVREQGYARALPLVLGGSAPIAVSAAPHMGYWPATTRTPATFVDAVRRFSQVAAR